MQIPELLLIGIATEIADAINAIIIETVMDFLRPNLKKIINCDFQISMSIYFIFKISYLLFARTGCIVRKKIKNIRSIQKPQYHLIRACAQAN